MMFLYLFEIINMILFPHENSFADGYKNLAIYRDFKIFLL